MDSKVCRNSWTCYPRTALKIKKLSPFLSLKMSFEWVFNDRGTQQIIILEMKASQVSRRNAHFNSFVFTWETQMIPTEQLCQSRNSTFQDNGVLRKEKEKHVSIFRIFLTPQEPNSEFKPKLCPECIAPESGLSCGSEISWKPIIMCDPRERGNSFLLFKTEFLYNCGYKVTSWISLHFKCICFLD